MLMGHVIYYVAEGGGCRLAADIYPMMQIVRADLNVPGGMECVRIIVSKELGTTGSLGLIVG